MKKRLRIALASVFLILLAASALYYLRPELIHSAAFPTAKKSAGIWQPQAIPPWALLPGQELVYELSYTGNGRFPGQAQQSFAVQLQGSLHILILSAAKDSYRVWLSIQPKGSAQLENIPEPMRVSLDRAWNEGIGARLGARGFDIQPQMPPDTDPTVAHFWQSFSERMQVVLPVALPTPVWLQKETMAGGMVTARYQIDPTALLPDQSREKIAMQKSFDAAPLPRRTIKGESLIVMHPRFAGLEQLQAAAHEVQELNGQSWVSDFSLKLEWREIVLQDAQRVAQLEARWAQSQATSQTASSQEASIQKIALGNLGLDDIWQQMGEPGRQNSQELYLKLKAWIFLNPAEVQRLISRLEHLDAADPRLKMAIRALAAAGQPEAQNALVDLLGQRQTDVPVARKIISTLGLVPKPTLKAQQSLERFSMAAEDSAVRRSSRLALGAMGQRLGQDQDPLTQKRAMDIEAMALANLRQAGELKAVAEALAVLGNCGISRLEDLAPWLKHPDPAIRSQAFFALRFAKAIETPHFLVVSYPAEASIVVRRQIMQAISLRAPDEGWFEALRNLLKHPLLDEDKIVLAKTLVGTARKHRSASLDLLDQLLEQTQDPLFRDNLAKYQETAQSQAAF